MKQLLIILLLALLPVLAQAGSCTIHEASTYHADANSEPIAVMNMNGNDPLVVATNNATSSESASVGSSTRLVRIVCDEAVYFKIATTTPDANSSDGYLPGNTIEYWGVVPGSIISLLDVA